MKRSFPCSPSRWCTATFRGYLASGDEHTTASWAAEHPCCACGALRSSTSSPDSHVKCYHQRSACCSEVSSSVSFGRPQWPLASRAELCSPDSGGVRTYRAYPHRSSCGGKSRPSPYWRTVLETEPNLMKLRECPASRTSRCLCVRGASLVALQATIRHTIAVLVRPWTN